MKAGGFFISFLLLVFLMLSCSHNVAKDKQPAAVERTDTTVHKNENYIYDCKSLKKEALQMDSIILRETETNVKLANRAIKAFTGFAYHCPADSVAPIYLIKTAQIAQAINNMPQAKIVLEKCINDYPNFRDRAAAIFLLAQLYDEVTFLNNEEQARVLYQKIMDEYPKSDWAASARGAILFIGKSDQQIMDELKKKKNSR